MVGPGDEIAAGAGGHRPLRASHADCEQVIDALKAAFVQGRLTRDEFDLRVGQVLAAYANLDALTADIPDIPVGLTATQQAERARERHNKKLIHRGTAAGAGAGMVFTAASVMVAGGSPVLGLVAVPLLGCFVAVLLAWLLTLLSRVFEKSSSRQPSQGAPPGASGKASQRLTSADLAGPPAQIGRDPRHTAEAVRRRLLRPPWPSLRATASPLPIFQAGAACAGSCPMLAGRGWSGAGDEGSFGIIEKVSWLRGRTRLRGAASAAVRGRGALGRRASRPAVAR